jgi:cell division protein FtsL
VPIWDLFLCADRFLMELEEFEKMLRRYVVATMLLLIVLIVFVANT